MRHRLKGIVHRSHQVHQSGDKQRRFTPGDQPGRLESVLGATLDYSKIDQKGDCIPGSVRQVGRVRKSRPIGGGIPFDSHNARQAGQEQRHLLPGYR